MSSDKSKYAELAAINVNAHLEKKQGLSYLSWVWALDQMYRHDPEADWEYGEPQKWGDTVMVFCTVTMFGKKRTAQLPVMDYKNKAVPNPDAFAVNTAMQRCLVKAIALHGLGLYVYAGEDLPPAGDDDKGNGTAPNGRPAALPSAIPANVEGIALYAAMTEDEKSELHELATAVEKRFNAGNTAAMVQYVRKQNLSDERLLALWTCLDSKIRTAYKKAEEDLRKTSALASQP